MNEKAHRYDVDGLFHYNLQLHKTNIKRVIYNDINTNKTEFKMKMQLNENQVWWERRSLDYLET